MDKSDLHGLLLQSNDFTEAYLYVKPDYADFEASVVCEQINTDGLLSGNYRLQKVRYLEDGLESGKYEEIGTYPNLSEARSAVAKLNDNPDPNRNN